MKLVSEAETPLMRGIELGVSESRACQLERAARERVLRGGVG